MARLNDDAQWIVLMGFLVSFSFFFLALVINQSTIVGQTTAESVIEFPKNDIQDVKSVIIQSGISEDLNFKDDITFISMNRKNAVVYYEDTTTSGNCPANYACMYIHYKNGVTEYNEYWVSP